MIPLATAAFGLSATAAALFLLSALALGSGAGRLIAVPSLAGRFLLGVLLISVWPWIPFALGTFGPTAVLLPLVAAPFAPWRRLAHAAGDLTRAARDGDALLRTLAGLAAAGALLAVVAGALPPAGMDALAYHLGLPAQYLVRETLGSWSSGGYGGYFQTFEFALLGVLALDETGTAAGLIAAAFLAATAASASRLAGALGASRLGTRAAAATVLTAPILLGAVALTKNDLLAVACVMEAAALLASRTAPRTTAGRTSVTRAVTLQTTAAAFLAGAAIAVKPTAALAVGPILLLAGASAPRVPLLAAVLLPSVWLLRNLVETGSPIPAAFLHGPAFTDFSRESGAGALGALHHLVLAFFFRYIDGTDGPLGPALLLLGAIAVLDGIRRPERRGPAALIVLAVAAWSLVGHSQARYLVPVLALAAALGASSPRLDRRLAAFLVLPILGWSLVYAGVRLETEHAAWSWHAGRISKERYFERWLASWAVQDEGRRRLPRNARVLAIGEGELFPLRRVADYDAFWEPSRALAWAHEVGHDTTRLHRKLVDRGYTHVLYNPGILAALLNAGRTPAPPCAEDFRSIDRLLGTLPVVAGGGMEGARILEVRTVSGNEGDRR